MEFNEDGGVKDPSAFRALIRGDQDKLDRISTDAEICAIVLGDDDDALQSLLRALFNASSLKTMHIIKESCKQDFTSLSVVPWHHHAYHVHVGGG
jgi:hypothetical protein